MWGNCDWYIRQRNIYASQMFQILNSKCFFQNFDGNFKIRCKNSKKFWKYKQNADCISTQRNISIKWNIHPLCHKMYILPHPSDVTFILISLSGNEKE